MNDLYPKVFSDWVALVGVLTPVITWTVAGLFRAIAYYNDQKNHNWKRLSELSLVLYNNNHQHGGFAQLMALHEIDRLGVDKRAKAALIAKLYGYWSKSGDPQLREELERLAKKYPSA